VAAGDGATTEDARLDLHGVLEATGDKIGLARVAHDIASSVEAAILSAVAAAPDATATLTDARETGARQLRRLATIGRSAAATAASSVVDRLVADGHLVRDGASLSLPGRARSIPGPDPVLLEAMARLERSLAVAAPPSLDEAATAAGCPMEGIHELERTGRIVVLDDDLAYATTTYDEITGTALRLATTAPLTPAALRDSTGTSRKYVMAILEDLDRRGVLLRTPDGHVPGPRAARSPVSAP
jgi:hypothetical protein